MNVVQFPDPNQPDPEHVLHRDYGVTMYRFALSFQHDGKTIGTDIWALSHEDAEQRVASMRETLVVDGQVFGSYPA